MYDFSVDYDAIVVSDVLEFISVSWKRITWYKIFGLIKKVFFTRLALLSTLASVNLLSFISMNNQECKVRPQIVNVNSKEPVFFPFSIKINKCSGSCDNINDPYVKLYVSDIVKNLNVKVFNLMSKTNKNSVKHVSVSVE